MFSVSQSVRGNLEILQAVFERSLTRESPIAPQPPHITVPLRMHQLAILHAMKAKELALQRGLPINSTETLYTNYGILGDKVGVGKTLMVLAHISQMSLEQLDNHSFTLQPRSTYNCFSLQKNTLPEQNLYDSLVVVPHTIYRQWQDTITNHTNLRACFLKTQRDIDKDNLLETLAGSHITLISNTLYPSFLHNLNRRFQLLGMANPVWMRVFYDEVDTIKIPQTCPQPPTRFTWFITATFEKLLSLNECYHSNYYRALPGEFISLLHPDLQSMLSVFLESHPMVSWNRIQSNGYFLEQLRCFHPARYQLVLRCASAFLDESVELPPLLRQTILCQSPAAHRIIQNTLPNEAEQALHAGDIQRALQILGVSSQTPLTLVEAATEYRKRDLERAKRRFAFAQEEDYSTPQAKEAALQLLQERIHRLEEQIQTIQERFEGLEKDICHICFEQGSSPVVTPCCSKRFCAGCILEWCCRSTRCPTCRQSFHPNQLISLSNVVSEGSIQSPITLPKKIDALQKIFHENPEGSFLVFSRYDNPFTASTLDSLPMAILQGNKDMIASTLSKFEKKQIRILILNSRHAAAGLNIPTATHVLLLHRMMPDEERQILGRAYRLGRTQPLHFIHLLHEHE